MQKSNIMQGSDAITSTQTPILVPLAPKSGITTITGLAPIATPISVAPPVSIITIILFSTNENQ